jgi:hypothetical protein
VQVVLVEVRMRLLLLPAAVLAQLGSPGVGAKAGLVGLVRSRASD